MALFRRRVQFKALPGHRERKGRRGQQGRKEQQGRRGRPYIRPQFVRALSPTQFASATRAVVRMALSVLFFLLAPSPQTRGLVLPLHVVITVVSAVYVRRRTFIACSNCMARMPAAITPR